jgi:hypothetical protein
VVVDHDPADTVPSASGTRAVEFVVPAIPGRQTTGRASDR